MTFKHWYLLPGKPSENHRTLSIGDDFKSSGINPSLTWTDEYSDCAYRIYELEGLEILSANGRDLSGINFSAPRFVLDFQGDFAVEVCISQVSDNTPQIGGLLIWKDRRNFLRLDKGVKGRYEIRLHGSAKNQRQVGGRGILHNTAKTHLRLERSGDEFTSYCSTDGENWLTCGKITLPMEDPIQIGIHAIGMIDRTIYCGEYKEGTATVFRNFRIWTREEQK